MKVIVAGMAKTGTKSMCAALKELGYSVYDYNENMLLLGKEWTKICAEGGSTEDFRRMYENVDAVTDIPACYYWDEIHKAFPDSKTAPKDKLLVFNVKEGWEPLCQFLNVKVPNKPFPRENVGGELIQQIIDKNPFFKRCKREMFVVITGLTALVAYCGYKLIRKSTFCWIKSAFYQIIDHSTS